MIYTIVFNAAGTAVGCSSYDFESENPDENFEPPQGEQVVTQAQYENYASYQLTSGAVVSVSAAAQADLAQAAAAATIADVRYGHETAGILVNGVPIDTGRDSQALITGAALSAVIDSTYVCTWKTVNGPVSLTATQLISIANAVRAHVQACFDREGVLLAAVTAGTYTEEMLTEGWPT